MSAVTTTVTTAMIAVRAPGWSWVWAGYGLSAGVWAAYVGWIARGLRRSRP